MTRDDLIKMLDEAYERGQSDLQDACKEAAFKAIEVAIAAEREACAQMVDHIRKEGGGTYGDAIRARGQA